MRTSFTIVMVLLWSITLAQEVNIQPFSTGFSSPVTIKHAGDSRLFVAERAGYIQVVNSNGSKNSTPFLNIDNIVINGGGERGLLGLAFHPNYVSNGYFYINYVNNSGNTVISRFTRSSSNPDIADATSELQLLTYSQPYTNHNGGDMAFGADGYLYISSGDGGSGGDPENRAQSLTTFLGKLLRIDVDGNSNGNYGIPPDNPFIGNTTGALEEIWAYGLRNAWKFSFDSSNGDLWIADVGQNAIEEINMVSSTASGLNYGWRCYEGNAPFNLSSNCPPSSNLTFPIAQYTHNDTGLFKCSITGGYRYRGTAFPNLVGLYFFADFCSNEIGTLEPSGSDWTMSFSPAFSGNGWTTFGEDINGELYIAGINSGTINKIIDTSLNIEENETFAVKLYPNPAKNEITLDISDSALIIQSLKIFSPQGKLISLTSTFEAGLTTLSIKNLANGIYFVEITTAEGYKTIKKLIKK